MKYKYFAYPQRTKTYWKVVKPHHWNPEIPIYCKSPSTRSDILIAKVHSTVCLPTRTICRTRWSHPIYRTGPKPNVICICVMQPVYMTLIWVHRYRPKSFATLATPVFRVTYRQRYCTSRYICILLYDTDDLVLLLKFIGYCSFVCFCRDCVWFFHVKDKYCTAKQCYSGNH